MRALDPLYRACVWVAGLAIVVMALIVPWGVFARYVLGRGAQWPEPIAILLMMIFTFVGAAAAYRAGAHIGVTMFTERLPPPWQRRASRLVDALMAAVCLFVAGYGARLVVQTMGQAVAELPWLPVGLTYLAIPLGALATLAFVIERALLGPQDARVALDAAEP